MKKLITLLMFAVTLSFTSTAQTNLTSIFNNTSDTVTNSGTKFLYTGVIKGFQKTLAIQFTLTEISGTTAGTISLEASIDGTNYYSYYGSLDSAYTFTASDVSSQSFRFLVKDVGDLYFRVKYVGSGTMSSRVTGRFLTRKEN
jgi:hypothetical protein